MIDLKLQITKEHGEWVVLLGNEVHLVTDETRLQPALAVGRGATKDQAKYDATYTLRELARKIDWGVL